MSVAGVSVWTWLGGIAAAVILVVPVAYCLYVLECRRLKRRLRRTAEGAGLVVESIHRADTVDHPWPKIRVVTGGVIATGGMQRQTTFHFLLFVRNERGVGMEVWARFERSPIPFVFGPPITEWRPLLEEAARAGAPIEPLRDPKKVVERARFGPFARRGR